MLKKIQDFIGGLHKTDNKSLVKSNEFVNGNNMIPQEDGTALKRNGRDLISQIITDQSKITGLIQNETEGGVKELYAITVTDIYMKDNGSWTSKFSGFTDKPFYSAYWQNKGFWGNGQEDIISTLANLIDLRLYVAEQGNNRISLFDKKDPYVFKKVLGEYGVGNGQFDSPQGIAIDSDNIFVADTENSRIQIFDKVGTYIASFTTTDKCYDVAVDSEWIYVVGKSGVTQEIKAFSKTTPYAVDRTLVTANDIKSCAVDEMYLYYCYTTYIKRIDKLTFGNSSNLDTTNVNGVVEVDRNEFDTAYWYLGHPSGLQIRDKTSPYAYTGYIDALIDDVRGVSVDNQYIYLTYKNTVKVYDKSMPAPNLIATISQTGSLGGDLTDPYKMAMEKVAQNNNSLFIGFLDAPAAPLAFWDITGGNIEAGTYNYRMTFSDGTNETNVSQESHDVVINASKGKVWLQLMQTSIPSEITQWVLYRKKDAGTYHQLSTIAITDTQYLDDLAESSISSASNYPIQSTLHPFLKSKIFTFYQESIWILYGKTLYWSGPFAPNDFPVVNTLGIDTRTDGVGLIGTDSGIFIFTRNSFAILEGWDIDNYFYRQLSNSVGALSHRSIQEYLKTVIWLDKNGIFLSSGTEPVKISSPRIDQIIQSIQIDNVDYICSVIYDDKYLLSIPASALVLVYDFKLKCFYTLDWIIHDFALVEDANDNLLLYMGGKDSAVYQLFINNADDDESGVPQDIPCDLETKHFDMDFPELKKWIHNLYVLAGGDGANNVTLNFKWKIGDNAEESRSITVSRTKQNNTVRPKGGRGTTVYFKITESGQQEFKLFGFGANLDILKKMKVHSQGG